jgi:hypothetical protein
VGEPVDYAGYPYRVIRAEGDVRLLKDTTSVDEVKVTVHDLAETRLFPNQLVHFEDGTTGVITRVQADAHGSQLSAITVIRDGANAGKTVTISARELKITPVGKMFVAEEIPKPKVVTGVTTPQKPIGEVAENKLPKVIVKDQPGVTSQPPAGIKLPEGDPVAETERRPWRPNKPIRPKG